MNGTLEFISIDVWRMLIHIANLLILMLLLKKFLFKPVQKILAKREEEIKNTYAHADEARTQAEAMREEYTERLSNAKQEAAEIVRDATLRAQTKSDEILENAKTKAMGTLKKAEEDIAREKQKVATELQHDISDIALTLASKVVEREVNGEVHKELIDDFIKNVGEKK